MMPPAGPTEPTTYSVAALADLGCAVNAGIMPSRDTAITSRTIARAEGFRTRVTLIPSLLFSAYSWLPFDAPD